MQTEIKGVPEFPKNFYWGSATSAHQVEGGNYNDWTEWERKNAKRLAQNARENPPAGGWPDFILNPPAGGPNPMQAENYISGRACDHYNRFREDFDIAKSLGHNAHRFSIEWSRVEPEEGKFNEKEIAHYREVIKALRGRGIEPFVTLWHWTLPIWVARRGGWENKKTIEYFIRYADKITSAFESAGNSRVKFWITLNEPEIYAQNAYLRGLWPPQKKTFLKFVGVLRNLAEAHKRSYSQILKNLRIRPGIGAAKNNSYFEGWATPFFNWAWNEWFLNQIRNHQDFIGLNYYFHNRIKGFRFNQNENKLTSDMGWEIFPEGTYHVLRNLGKYKKPIYITENGIADAADTKRAAFTRDHLSWIAKAIAEGVDVRGYFHWSLLDNFEWDKGFWPRFGLVEVDYNTMKRRIRPSAWEYKKIIDSPTRLRANPEQRRSIDNQGI